DRVIGLDSGPPLATQSSASAEGVGRSTIPRIKSLVACLVSQQSIEHYRHLPAPQWAKTTNEGGKHEIRAETAACHDDLGPRWPCLCGGTVDRKARNRRCLAEPALPHSDGTATGDRRRSHARRRCDDRPPRPVDLFRSDRL